MSELLSGNSQRKDWSLFIGEVRLFITDEINLIAFIMLVFPALLPPIR